MGIDVVVFALGILMIVGYFNIFLEILPKKEPLVDEFVSDENRTAHNKRVKFLFGINL